MVFFGVHWANHESFDKDYIVFKCQLSTESHCSVYGNILDNSQTCCYRNMIPDHNNFPQKWRFSSNWRPCWHSPKAGHGRFQDAKTTTGFSALHFACALGNLSATDSLLRLRADINARTSHEVSALHLATENGHLMIVTWRNVMWWEFSLSKGGGCIVLNWLCMVLYRGNALAIARLLKYDSIHTLDHGEERIGEAHDWKFAWKVLLVLV